MPKRALSPNGIASIEPPETGQVDYFDTSPNSPKGFYLRIGYGGTRTWGLLYWHNGKKRRLKLGTYPAFSLADARERARVAKRSVEDGKDPAAEKQQTRKADTVAMLADAYLEKYAKVRKRSWRRDESVLRGYVKPPPLGPMKVHEVTRRDIKALLTKIHATAPIQANRTLEIIRGMFNWAIREEEGGPLLTVNPCTLIEPPAQEEERQRHYSPAELKALWQAFAGQGGTVDRSLRVMALTLQREMEVLRMRKADLDLPAGRWVVPPEHAKNGKAHVVPLVPAAVAVIEEAIAESGKSEWVFPQPDTKKHATRSIFNTSLLRIREASKVADFRPHDLRKTGATVMGELGVTEFDIGRVLNHTRTGVTGRHYNLHMYEPEKRRALALWADRLAGIVGDTPPPSNVVQLPARA